MRISSRGYVRAVSSAVLFGLIGLAAADVEAAEMKKVTLSHAGATTLRLPFYVAYDKGYFKQENLDLEIVETQSGSDAMKMLAGGSVNFSTGQLLDAVNLSKQGINIVGVAMLTSRLTNSVVIRKSLAGQVKTMKDLEGRTVGVTSVGSGTWQFAGFVGRLQGADTEKFNYIGVGTGANVIGAIKSGRVDAMSYSDPENFKLVQDGDAEFLVDMGDDAVHKKLVGETYLNNQVMVLADYAKRNPDTVQGFVNALQKALDWMNKSSPEEITRSLMGFPGFQKADYNLLLISVRRQLPVRQTAQITKDAFDNAMKFPMTIGLLKEAVPMPVVVDNTFSDKAAKRGN